MRSNPVTPPLRAALLAASAFVATGIVLAEPAPVSAAALVVDTLSDNPADGNTLREAVADANAAIGDDVIVFHPSLSGTIHLDGAPISIEDSVEIDGDDRITISGGGTSRVFISFFPGTDLTLAGMTLIDGWSLVHGGAIEFFQGDDLTLDGVTISDSTSEQHGGGLAVHATTGFVTIENSSFEGNTATNGSGGAVSLVDVGLGVWISESVIDGNEASVGLGGGIRAEMPTGTFQMENTDVTDNDAPAGTGGGLFVQSEYVEVKHGAISDNVALDSGGFFLHSSLVEARLMNMVVERNSAESTGAGALLSPSVVRAHFVEVLDNDADVAPGLVAAGGVAVEVEDSSFVGNDGVVDGGALSVLTTPDVTIERTTIAGNTAPNAPGLRTVFNSVTTIEHSTFHDNTATVEDAGAILASGPPGDVVEVFMSTISGNTVAGDGGAVRAHDVRVDVVGSTVVDNSAGGAGGGVFLTGVAELHVDHSILANDAPVAPDVSGPVEPDHALIGDTSGAVVLVGPGLITGVDPMLWPLAWNGGPTRTHLPAPDSPVVDGGNPAIAAIPGMFDQRERERFVGVVDLGSVERQPNDPLELPADPPDVSPGEGPGGEEPSGGAGSGPLWIPVDPARIHDTRADATTIDGVGAGGGRLPADSQVKVDVAGRAGVPADARAVIANVTAIQSPETGYLTVHGCETPRPLTASLNYSAGVNLGNEVIASLDSDGDLCVYTSASVEFTIDVVGYVPDESPYETIVPTRLLDTRAGGETIDGDFAGIGRPGAGRVIELDVVGRGGVAGDVAAVVMYVGAVRGSSVGYVTAWDCAGDPPNASSLNHVSGINRGNEVVVAPGEDGRVCLFTSADVDVTVDVVGVLPAGTDGLTILDAPSRLVDSRPGHATVDGSHAATGAWGAGEVRQIQIAGRAGVPDAAETVAMTITAVQGTGVGWATVFGCTGDVPHASSVNFVPGVNGGNEVIAGLDDAGRICVFTSVGTHITIDVTAATL